MFYVHVYFGNVLLRSIKYVKINYMTNTSSELRWHVDIKNTENTLGLRPHCRPFRPFSSARKHNTMSTEFPGCFQHENNMLFSCLNPFPALVEIWNSTIILRVIFIIILHGREKLIILNEKIPKVCRLENQIRKICRFPASPRINVYLLSNDK